MFGDGTLHRLLPTLDVIAGRIPLGVLGVELPPERIGKSLRLALALTLPGVGAMGGAGGGVLGAGAERKRGEVKRVVEPRSSRVRFAFTPNAVRREVKLGCGGILR